MTQFPATKGLPITHSMKTIIKYTQDKIENLKLLRMHIIDDIDMTEININDYINSKEGHEPKLEFSIVETISHLKHQKMELEKTKQSINEEYKILNHFLKKINLQYASESLLKGLSKISNKNDDDDDEASDDDDEDDDGDDDVSNDITGSNESDKLNENHTQINI